MPFDAADALLFDPEAVPTVAQLLQELGDERSRREAQVQKLPLRLLAVHRSAVSQAHARPFPADLCLHGRMSHQQVPACFSCDYMHRRGKPLVSGEMAASAGQRLKAFGPHVLYC